MDRMDIPREEELNEQRQVDDETGNGGGGGILSGIDDAVDSIVRPFATEDLSDEEAERQRRLNDAEQS